MKATMRTKIDKWMPGLALTLLSCTAKAAQVADAAQLSSGAANVAQQAHPVFIGIIHTIFIIIVVSMAAMVFSAVTNPRSTR